MSLAAPDPRERADLTPHPRSRTHYWKCDRPAAFHGTGETRDTAPLEPLLFEVLQPHARGRTLVLKPAGSQGNHLTWLLRTGDRTFFVRVEDGPEQDDYLEVESRVMDEIRALGIAAPKVHVVDASRAVVPFAWQVMDHLPCPDLNHWHKLNRLDLTKVMERVGRAVARWQALRPEGFGPFVPARLREQDELVGFHTRYQDYFLLNLEKHLCLLVNDGFLSEPKAEEIQAAIDRHGALLRLDQGCLVHKDLALWNILGTEDSIEGYIDWDDAISGDCMDDLSLLACFHDGDAVRAALRGYASVRPLPQDHRRRFWLHLLRNMIVKAVIRVGAGYFQRGGDFFLMARNGTGEDLKHFTRERLARALQGLREDLEITSL